MLSKIIATVFFIGYFPVAPGTMASAFVITFLLIFKPDNMILLAILIVALFVGIVSSEMLAKHYKVKDPNWIVIDEFVGCLTAVIFLPMDWKILLAGFLIFRFFDIIKPPPIRQAERIGGGLGIMIDDLLAGFISNLLIRIFLLV
ncbi:phosphatidylglycerophosphatase A [Thermodesulfovibrio aggregans]|uniref:Phosphatidylglycerophosphatase A n=1 Tax=Thermodesulfovibrio aggregans TaxID=86166 RepID=A0A0U9HRG6_9BACT|nr:phosphatidylglycerophosphatase A [Thermodesulfovibrio aggregans]GAQ95635.1 phosphatidylglycerophosphatase A [Thermodesulfovibrio aggregans]